MSEAVAAPVTREVTPFDLTQQDAHNLLILMQRTPTNGLQESQLMTGLALKLQELKGDFNPQEANG